jgi:hypothetical protein
VDGAIIYEEQLVDEPVSRSRIIEGLDAIRKSLDNVESSMLVINKELREQANRLSIVEQRITSIENFGCTREPM